mgnify:FL=1
MKALQGKEIPVYGTGQNIRDWLYVDYHVHALLKVLQEGKPGETYNVGEHNEKRNIEVVNTICDTQNELVPKEANYREQISFVNDRPGHDDRYAIDASNIQRELGWVPEENL